LSPALIFITWTVIFLTSLIAVRMGRSALRTRSLPEALLSIFFFGGFAGYALIMLPRTFALSDGAILFATRSGATLLTLPSMAVVFFTWQVFRRDSTWARVAAFSLATFTGLTTISGQWLAAPLGLEQILSLEPGSPYYWITSLSKAACFAWSCSEALIFYRKAKRRLATGLIDALVANRFLLWAIWSGSAASMVVIRIVSALLVGATSGTSVLPLPLIVSMLIAGTSCISAVWLTFAPPAFYRRMIQGDPVLSS
jgi:hypothetical protein